MKSRVFFLAAILCVLLAAPALAVDFTDAKGREVSVENPQRVVSLYSSYGDAWMLAGGELVGSVEDSEGSVPEGAVNLGRHTQPGMEQLFALDPDFVLLAENVAAHGDVGAVLESAGIPHAYFYTPDWRSYMDSIALFASVTGRDDLYRAQLEAVQQPIEEMLSEAASLDGFGQTTALLLRANSTNVKARNSETGVAGSVLKDMGLVNLADGESPLSENLSMEAILTADPDFIFIITAGSDTDAAMESLRSVLTDNPAWATLTAVREGRCVVLDRELFHYHPNERWAGAYAFVLDLLKEFAA